MSDYMKDQLSLMENPVLSGNIYMFHAFDIGDEINLEKAKNSGHLTLQSLTLSKYFKNYHIPLGIEVPKTASPSQAIGAKAHNFGAISITYKAPFKSSLEELR